MSVRLVVLDRDGVVNHDSREFIKHVSEWRPIDGSIEAIARLHEAGYTVTIASNQSGIGRGLLDVDTLEEIHAELARRVRDAGGNIDRIVYCPHLPTDGCDCRKPRPGLLLKLGDHYGVSMHGVPVVGDSLRDLQAAHRVGARPMLVRTGNGRDTEARLDDVDFAADVFDDLAAACDALLG